MWDSVAECYRWTLTRTNVVNYVVWVTPVTAAEAAAAGDDVGVIVVHRSRDMTSALVDATGTLLRQSRDAMSFIASTGSSSRPQPPASQLGLTTESLTLLLTASVKADVTCAVSADITATHTHTNKQTINHDICYQSFLYWCEVVNTHLQKWAKNQTLTT